MFIRSFSIIVLLSLVLPVRALDVPLEFEDPEQQHRYAELIEEIRCLVCQNQSLADSSASLAQDLRQEIFDMIIDGKNNDEILAFLVERYGDFVLYRPPLKGSTYVLWLMPFIFLILAVLTVIYVIRGRAADEDQELTQGEREQLNQLLSEKESKE